MGKVSQLEIYKINAGKITFRQLLLGKRYYKEEENLDDKQIIHRLFTAMINLLSKDSVWTYKNEPKGLTLFSNTGEAINTILSYHSSCSLIEGFIDGGPFNRIGNITPKDDKSKVKRIGKNEIVTQRYYFYLSIPLDSNIALLFIEKKGEDSISKIVRFFLQHLLKNDRKTYKYERYIPKALIQEYRSEGIVNSFVYSFNMTSGVIDGEGVDPHEENYDIEVKITPPNKKNLHFDNMKEIVQSIGKITMKMGEKIVKFSDTKSIKAIVSKDSKSFKMNIDDFQVKPFIELDGELQEIDGSCLKRKEIKEFCDLVLSSIKEEVYNIRNDEG